MKKRNTFLTPWQTPMLAYQVSNQQANMMRDAAETIWFRTGIMWQQAGNPTAKGQREMSRMYTEKADAVTLGTQAFVKGWTNLFVNGPLALTQTLGSLLTARTAPAMWAAQQKFWEMSAQTYATFWHDAFQTWNQTVHPFATRAAANAKRLKR